MGEPSMSSSGPPDGPDLAVLASAVSRQAADLEIYAGFMIATLQDALPPDELSVDREQSLAERLRGRPGRVRAVSVRLGESRFQLERHREGAVTRAVIAHEVNGIVLSRRQVDLAEWSTALVRALAVVAEHNAAAEVALSRLTSFTV